MTPRHNKKRNTAFLYEALVREVIKQSLNKDVKKRDGTISILKENFNKNSILGKELKLFKALLETKGTSERTAEKLIDETKKEYKNLDKKKIFEAQSALIKNINKNVSKAVFSNFVPNYKDLATLSQIFSGEIPVKNRVLLEESLLKRISHKGTGNKNVKRNKITNLVVNGFIKKFNDKYGADLFENQKNLLGKFILSFVDQGVDFKVFLNEELHNLRKSIESSFELQEIKKDKNMSDKMKEVLKLLETINEKPIDADMLQKILKIQTLAEEVVG